MVLTISLVEPESLLVLEPSSSLQAGSGGSRKGRLWQKLPVILSVAA
jgi:hypothetical protein